MDITITFWLGTFMFVSTVAVGLSITTIIVERAIMILKNSLKDDKVASKWGCFVIVIVSVVVISVHVWREFPLIKVPGKGILLYFTTIQLQVR